MLKLRSYGHLSAISIVRAIFTTFNAFLLAMSKQGWKAILLEVVTAKRRAKLDTIFGDLGQIISNITAGLPRTCNKISAGAKV